MGVGRRRHGDGVDSRKQQRLAERCARRLDPELPRPLGGACRIAAYDRFDGEAGGAERSHVGDAAEAGPHHDHSQ